MQKRRRFERGEGKVGCLVTLIVVVLLGGIIWKVLPIYAGHMNLLRYAEDIAGGAATRPEAEIQGLIFKKAEELGIREATQPGSVAIQKSGDYDRGSCAITFNYKRPVDFFGVYKTDIVFNKRLERPYLNAKS